ncbi:hypothetical protein HY251_05490 [bacterium]|nr:hypothetical protein [bacterium]
MHQTALNAKHKSHGARMVEFGGWEMPVHYESIVLEHETVRTKAGLFDLQHMGRLRLTGKDRVAFLEGIITQAVASAKPGMARYSLVTNEQGHALDDIIFYTLPESLVVIVNAGRKDKGARPCGLGARDTLRLEAGMPLYGHELELDVNPFEAGLDFAVYLDKPFVGQEALARIKKDGPSRRVVGFECEGKRIPRQGAPIFSGPEQVGKVTSGTRSPTLDKVICMGFVPAALAASSSASLEVEVGGQRYKLRRVDLPFYSRTRKKK